MSAEVLIRDTGNKGIHQNIEVRARVSSNSYPILVQKIYVLPVCSDVFSDNQARRCMQHLCPKYNPRMMSYSEQPRIQYE
jgi:hypothetical protein